MKLQKTVDYKRLNERLFFSGSDCFFFFVSRMVSKSSRTSYSSTLESKPIACTYVQRELTTVLTLVASALLTVHGETESIQVVLYTFSLYIYSEFGQPQPS